MPGPTPRMALGVKVHEDREHVYVVLEMDGAPLGWINLDPSTALNHIEKVADARAALLEPVAPTLDPGSRLRAITDPVWKTEATPTGPVLALRHPGLGWLGFQLPPHEARALAESLRALADQQPPQR